MTARPAATDLPGSLLKSLQGANLALRAGADGRLVASADTLTLQQLALHTPFGPADVGKATLSQVRLQLAAPAGGGELQLAGLAAARLEVDTAQVTPQPPATGAPAAGGAPLRLEPLGTVHGRIVVSIRDARWALDAEVSLPVVAGRIDFDRVVVEHVGPNSTMSVGRDGIYVQAPNRERTPLVRFAAPELAGVRYEQPGGFMGLGVSDRGSIDLRAFVEAIVNGVGGGAPPPVTRPVAGDDMGGLLGRTKLAGELQLADGAVGTERHHVVLAERAQGRNGIALDAAVLGQRLVLRLPELAASHAVFEWQGRAGRTGALAAAVEAHVSGLGTGGAPAVALKLQRLAVQDIRLGDLSQS